ncbi:MAG: leucine-rich repeat protein [Muribaculaceae bacterium]|jgi:hypothetical protein|nr:leucine-rich repeat protein [Muribaculaceae bacterium]
MKLKIIFILLFLCTVGESAFSYDFTVGKFDYNILQDSVSVEVAHANFSGTSVTENAIEVPPYVSSNGKNYKVSKIGEKSFSRCLITSVTLPNTIRCIGAYAFAGCGPLQSINFPYSLRSIEEHAFSFCSELKEISLPDSLEKIDTAAFYACCLRQIAIGKYISSIDNEAFSMDTSYPSDATFAIVARSETPILCDTTFVKDINNNLYSRVLLLVPEQSISRYTATIPWNRFENIRACTKVTSVTLNKNLLNLDAGVSEKLIANISLSGTPISVEEPYVNGCIWSSSNSSVATVNTDGSVTAVSGGIAVIKALAADGSGMCDSCIVTVPVKTVSIALNQKELTINLKSKATLSVEPISSSSILNSIVWTSTDNNIVTVDSGMVTAVGSGVAKIVVTANGSLDCSDTCNVTVVDDHFIASNLSGHSGSFETLPVSLINNSGISSFKCTLVLPDSITIKENENDGYEVALTSRADTTYSINASLRTDSSFIINAASKVRTTFNGIDGILFNVNLAIGSNLNGIFPIKLRNIKLVDSELHELDAPDVNIQIEIKKSSVSRIVNDEMKIKVTGHDVLIESPSNSIALLVYMDGRVRKLSLKEGLNSFAISESGIYCIGNKKFIIK